MVLDWRSSWFSLLRRDGLDLYITIAVAARILPTTDNFEVRCVQCGAAGMWSPACERSFGLFGPLYRELSVGQSALVWARRHRCFRSLPLPQVHFEPLRRTPTANPAPGAYGRIMRWLLGIA